MQKDPGLFPRLRRVMRSTIGVEMEGAAIGELASHFEKRGIVVKAVSDHGDLQKDDSFREFACRASAEVLLAFLLKHVEPAPALEKALLEDKHDEPGDDDPRSDRLGRRAYRLAVRRLRRAGAAAHLRPRPGALRDRVPSKRTRLPSQGTQIPSEGTHVPPKGTKVHPKGAQVPSKGTKVPSERTCSPPRQIPIHSRQEISPLVPRSASSDTGLFFDPGRQPSRRSEQPARAPGEPHEKARQRLALARVQDPQIG